MSIIHYINNVNKAMIMSHRFTQLAADKGWSNRELSERWGYTPRHMSRIAKKPSAMHIDALNGLPNNLCANGQHQYGEAVWEAASGRAIIRCNRCGVTL